MGTVMRLVVVVALLTASCTGAKYGASFKTIDGSAMAKPGISPGRTNIVRVADVGGPLGRFAIYVMGAIMAVGSVQTKTTVTDSDHGDYIVRTTETTVTGVDEAGMQAAQSMLDSASADRPVGIMGSLEVSTRDLGGDTSGFRYDVGDQSEAFGCGPHLACTVYIGIGVGSWTFHDRTRRERVDQTVMETPNISSTSSYFGSPVRLTIAPTAFFAVYLQADLNWVTAANTLLGDTGSPSPWTLGAELRFKWLYARAGLLAGRLEKSAVSSVLEVGLGF
ncbi:hypothetical protein BH11MYX2_BH11MYX2_21680 [soil metagenome]